MHKKSQRRHVGSFRLIELVFIQHLLTHPFGVSDSRLHVRSGPLLLSANRGRHLTSGKVAAIVLAGPDSPGIRFEKLSPAR